MSATTSLTRRRDDDFTACLRRILADPAAGRLTADQIIDRAMACRPKAYYLSFRTVQTLFIRLYGHPSRRRCETLTFPCRVTSAARGRWRDICDAITRYLLLHRAASISEAVTFVLSFERPDRFYISPRKARALLASVMRDA